LESTFQILLSVLGADAATGTFDDLNAKTGQAVGNLARLAGAAVTLNSVIGGVGEAFGLGAHFEELSARTGQSVQDLVVLSRAFQMVGLSGDEVGLMANRLQRAMSGMSEMGQPTTKAFSDLGISVKQLSELSFNDQLTELAAGFSKIQNPAERSAVAMQIFGRSGGQMLQLLEREGLLKQAGEDAGSLAARLQDDSRAFEDITNKLSLLKTRFQEMFVVLAEQLLPVLRTIGGLIGSLSLAPIGAALGTGGILAFSGILASSVARRLDTAAWEWATSAKYGNAFAGSVLVPLTSGLSELFALILPAIIITAIGGAIIAAVTQGLLDAQNQADRTLDAGARGVHADRAKLGTARDAADIASARTQMQKDIAEAQKIVDAIEAKQREYNSINQSAASSGSRTVLSLSGEEEAQLEAAKNTVAQLQETLNRPIATDSIFAANKMKDTKAALDAMIPTMDEMEKKVDALHLAQMAPAARLPELQKRRAAQVDIMNSPTTGLDDKEAAVRNKAAELAIADIDKDIDATQKQILETQKQQTAEAKKLTDQAEQLQVFQLQAQLEAAKAAGDAQGAERIKEQIDLLQFKKELVNLGATDLSAAQKRVDAEHQLFQVEEQRRDAQKADQALKDQMEQNIGRLQNSATAATGSEALTDVQKWEIRKQVLEQEIAMREKYVQVLQAQYNAAQLAGDKVTAAEKDNALTAARKDLSGTQNKLNQLGPDPNSFTQQWAAALTRLQNNWQVTWKSIGNSLTQIMSGLTNSVSQNITGLIMRTESWRQALASVANTLLSSVVGAIVKTAVEWMAGQLMMAIFGKSLAASQLLALQGIAEGESAIWAGPATLATIASYGGAAVAAPGEILMAMGMTQGLAAASSGGYFPGDPTKARGIFHGDEVVFSAPAVRRLGPENLMALHAAGLSSSGSMAGSGVGGGSERPERTIVYADHSVMRDRLMKDPSFTNHIVDVGRRRRGEIFGL